MMYIVLSEEKKFATRKPHQDWVLRISCTLFIFFVNDFTKIIIYFLVLSEICNVYQTIQNRVYVGVQ
ncbi:hypothetical protein COJ83_25105 [Bacillus cereus]|nr:hypothetical protein CN437_19410 [Bacillus cereus]PFO63737.1 hypothetical protein COJ83_25105 [Bacillus cereus]PGW08182.1 hypothetical protein COD97_25145 [Bacillus cereus]PGW97314.1 hypothetical protein COE32_08595 [Bacillus cereus]PGY39551.1 hypothetical protein COE06_18140 [Bacillus cereus]